MNEYLNEKKYSSLFGDIVPVIIANAIAVNLHIIEEDHHENIKPILVMSESAGQINELFLLKTNEHYDALLPKWINTESLPGTKHTARAFHSNCIPADNQHHAINETRPSIDKNIAISPVIHNLTSTEKSPYQTSSCSMQAISICFWNVHGLNQEMLSDDICGLYLKKHDIIMFCETWAEPSDSFYIEGFQSINFARNFRHRNAIRGSGGLYLFIRNALVDGIDVLHNIDDLLVWLKLDKNFFGLKRDVYAANCYVVPENSPYYRFNTFEIIENEIAKIPSDCDLLICADFNSHVNTTHDFLETIPGSNDVIDEPMISKDLMSVFEIPPHLKTRVSKDSRPLNNHGKLLLELCKSTGLLIVNGRIGQDKEEGGRYTWVNDKSAGVNDFMIASPSFFDHITDFCVGNKFPESDHLPLVLSINCKATQAHHELCNPNQQWENHYRFTWSKHDLENLQFSISDDISAEYRHDFRNSMANIDHTEKVTEKFDFYISQACRRTFNVKKCTKQYSRKRAHWFDKQCRDLRYEAMMKELKICKF